MSEVDRTARLHDSGWLRVFRVGGPPVCVPISYAATVSPNNLHFRVRANFSTENFMDLLPWPHLHQCCIYIPISLHTNVTFLFILIFIFVYLYFYCY